MQEEKWREVPGTDGWYEISIDTKEGRCRSWKNKYGLRKEPYYLSNKPDKKGYIYWRMSVNGVAIVHQAARWIAITFPELVQNEYFEGAEIDHIDTDRTNNNPSNLRWTDRAGQMNNPLTKIHNSEARKGKHPSEETRRKMSLARKGRTIPEETRKKISDSHKGLPVSEETRRKLSAAMTGRPGHKATEKQKRAAAEYNRKTKSKPILQLDMITGKVIKEHVSLAAAAIAMEEQLGKKVYETNISSAAKSPVRSSCGFRWKWK